MLDRLAAYRSALIGSECRSLVALGDFTRESGAEAMRLLLADDPKLDAVFVGSDLMADGALRTLRQAGRRITDDVAVIGFDAVEIARYIWSRRSPPSANRSTTLAASWPARWSGSPAVRTSNRRWCYRRS
jgi:DNA-binding LacI/PurR family transcriptional regulator